MEKIKVAYVFTETRDKSYFIFYFFYSNTRRLNTPVFAFISIFLSYPVDLDAPSAVSFRHQIQRIFRVVVPFFSLMNAV